MLPLLLLLLAPAAALRVAVITGEAGAAAAAHNTSIDAVLFFAKDSPGFTALGVRTSSEPLKAMAALRGGGFTHFVLPQPSQLPAIDSGMMLGSRTPVLAGEMVLLPTNAVTDWIRASHALRARFDGMDTELWAMPAAPQASMRLVQQHIGDTPAVVVVRDRVRLLLNTKQNPYDLV
jgi:hypothetical protein